MPVATASNGFLVGLHKQTNESTVGTTAEYSVPVYSADIGPRSDFRRIEVTDSAAIEGDVYKGPLSWSGSFETPAFAAPLGVILQSLWPTDTKTGVGPYNHAFSGLGGTQSWVAWYTNWSSASAYKQTFGKGLATNVTFTCDQDGGPLRVATSAVGQTVTKEAHTVTTAAALADGYFTLQATGCKIELDVDTPNVNPSTQPEKIRNFALSVSRSVSPQPVADSALVTVLGQGKVENTLSMEFLYSSFDAYEASYFGAVGGTSLSSTVVTGALELTANHTVQTGGTWQLLIYIPAVVFVVTPPTPNPDGSPLALSITGYIQKPTSGDHVVPTLINGVSAAY